MTTIRFRSGKTGGQLRRAKKEDDSCEEAQPSGNTGSSCDRGQKRVRGGADADNANWLYSKQGAGLWGGGLERLGPIIQM